MYYMPMVTLRVDEADKQAWENRAGGARRLSAWIREQCNAAAGTDGKSSHTDSPPIAAARKLEREPRVPRGGDRDEVPADEARESARVGSSRSSKTKCEYPNHGRKGWKCRGCGEMF